MAGAASRTQIRVKNEIQVMSILGKNPSSIDRIQIRAHPVFQNEHFSFLKASLLGIQPF